MDLCTECGAAMAYRYNLNWARTPRGAEYAWICVADASHVVEDDTGVGATS